MDILSVYDYALFFITAFTYALEDFYKVISINEIINSRNQHHSIIYIIENNINIQMKMAMALYFNSTMLITYAILLGV